MCILDKAKYFLRQECMLTHIDAESILHGVYSNSIIVMDGYDLI